jgi:hypothetical protein
MSKLKSLRSLGAFDGEKESKELPRDVDLPKCKHKNVTLIRNKLQCKCGAEWSGAGVEKIYSLLISQ